MSQLKPVWTLAKAVDLCRTIEKFAPVYGCHVALTGGCLYKFDARKDVDVLLYRIRQVEKIDIAGLRETLAKHGVHMGEAPTAYENTWVIKGSCEGGPIDFFFPEAVFESPDDGFEEI